MEEILKKYCVYLESCLQYRFKKEYLDLYFQIDDIQINVLDSNDSYLFGFTSPDKLEMFFQSLQ